MKGKREQKINRIARKRARRAEKRKDRAGVSSKPMRAKEYRAQKRLLIAYDLETTRIRAGETPTPLYLTGFGEDFRCSVAIKNDAHLLEILETRFLIADYNRARFVAWNGNNFDVYLLARALLLSSHFTIRPYLTRSKNLRGLKVITVKKHRDEKGRDRFMSWEFLDGIAMTGLTGTTLKKFLTQFAPDYAKLDGPDFEGGENFNASNPDHIRYAERDSEGLFHAMAEAERIMVETFGIGLQPTIGNLGIKIFQSNLPIAVTVWKPELDALNAIRNEVLRGGFCHASRRYDGPLWKYDLNQAYAAAMRDAMLPAGTCFRHRKVEWKIGNVNPYAKAFICRVRGSHPRNKVPFYCRSDGSAVFALTEIPDTWVTSIEYKQLISEGAQLEVSESYFWDEHFNMRAFVDRLEKLRSESPGGPSGAQGTLVKMIGNNAYGKTVERLDGLELVMALECPDGFSNYQTEGDALEFVWYRFADPVIREYHQPQIGAFITAHVRMVVRQAILKAPDAWLYADTDCVAFTHAVNLPIDPKRYGLWKIEESGTDFLVIEKKVYAKKDGSVKHAKGMNVKGLTSEDFQQWYSGTPPTQLQVHRQNFVKFITGSEMFTSRERVGQRVARAAKSE